MRVRLLITAAAIGLGVCAANAQSHPSATSGTATVGQQSNQPIPNEIKQKLSADGFTNVQVVPGSYLVSAKDKNGDPVMMVIGPHSMTILTELPKSNSSTTGSSTGSSGQSGTSSSSSK